MVKNPFVVDVGGAWLQQATNLFPDLAATLLQTQLINIQSDDELELIYHTKPTEEFWLQCVPLDCKELKSLALRIIGMFGSTYICESGFSIMRYIKKTGTVRDLLQVTWKKSCGFLRRHILHNLPRLHRVPSVISAIRTGKLTLLTISFIFSLKHLLFQIYFSSFPRSDENFEMRAELLLAENTREVPFPAIWGVWNAENKMYAPRQPMVALRLDGGI